MVFKLSELKNISDIEDCFEDLDKVQVQGDLMLSLQAGRNDFGTQALICQFVNTWVRKTGNSSCLILDAVMRPTAEEIEIFTKQVCNLSAVLMIVRTGRKIYYRGKKEDITKETTAAVIKSLSGMVPLVKNGQKLFRQNSGTACVICFDHSSEIEYQYNGWFYKKTDLLEEKGFTNFYKASIQAIFGQRSFEKDLALLPVVIESVSGIIKELFENTDKYARNGFGIYAQVPLSPNMRGVIIQLHKGNRAYYLEKSEVNDPYHRYFSHPAIFNNEQEEKLFLEISVIDSGPGFAPLRRKRPLNAITPLAEKVTVIECLEGLDRTAEKRGLKRIANYLLRHDGFFSLRTGRLNLYRNFLIKMDKVENEMTKSFFDWFLDDTGIEKLNEASGAAVTIIYPVSKF